MQIKDYVDAFSGWGFGYGIGSFNQAEAEVRRGKNYAFASLFQWIQVIQLTAVAEKCLSRLPDGMIKTAAKIGCYCAPKIALIVFPFCAVVTYESYSRMAAWLNNCARFARLQSGERFKKIIKIIDVVFPLPEKLEWRTTRICHWISNHSGPLMRVVGVISAIAMPVVFPSFGAGMLLAILYEAAHAGGLVPTNISLFMSKYGGVIASFGMLISGGFWLRLINAMIILQAFPTVSCMLQHRLDDSIKYVIQSLFHFASYVYKKRFNCSLEEHEFFPKNFYKGLQWHLKAFEAPLQRHRQMDYDTIKTIFALGEIDINEIDPAHCSKGVFDIYTLPENKDFTHLLNHFKKVDWTSRYEQVKGKCAEDEHFQECLQENYNTTLRADQTPITLKALQDQTPTCMYNETLRRWEYSTQGLQTIETCLAQLAQQADLSKEQYLANWVHDRMQGLVDGLLGKIFVPGSPEDLQVAKDHVPKIIAYLDSLLGEEMLTKDPMYEGLLMKMALEGGRYCAAGVKRATLEAVGLIAQQKIQGDIKLSKVHTTYHGFAALLVAIGACAAAYQASLLHVRLSVACVALAAVGAIFKAYRNYQAILKNQADEADAVINKHDIKIRAALEQSREQMMQREWSGPTQMLGRIALDEHIIHGLKTTLALGFLPLSPLQRRKVGLVEVFGSFFYISKCQRMMEHYAKDMDDALRICLEDMGAALAIQYFQDMINKNALLTPAQRQEFIDKLANDMRAPKFSKVHRGFRRLIMVSLGILKKPSPMPHVALNDDSTNDDEDEKKRF